MTLNIKKINLFLKEPQYFQENKRWGNMQLMRKAELVLKCFEWKKSLSHIYIIYIIVSSEQMVHKIFE